MIRWGRSTAASAMLLMAVATTAAVVMASTGFRAMVPGITASPVQSRPGGSGTLGAPQTAVVVDSPVSSTASKPNAARAIGISRTVPAGARGVVSAPAGTVPAPSVRTVAPPPTPLPVRPGSLVTLPRVTAPVADAPAVLPGVVSGAFAPRRTVRGATTTPIATPAGDDGRDDAAADDSDEAESAKSSAAKAAKHRAKARAHAKGERRRPGANDRD